MRKTASSFSGVPRSTSARPSTAWWTISPSRASRNCAPGRRPASTYLSCRCRSMRARRSAENPDEARRLIWFMRRLPRRWRPALGPCLPAGRKRQLLTKEAPSMQTVSTEVRGRTAIVTIERPQARNAVDGPTAQQLYDAFKAFDADEALDVAILQGRGGAFCAGADLKGVAEGRGNPVHREGDLGPMGCTRLAL